MARGMMYGVIGSLLFLTAGAASSYAGVAFVNGDFEAGLLNGWTLSTGPTSALGTSTAGTGLSSWSPGGTFATGVSSAIVTSGTDPHVPIGRTYGGSYAARVGDDVPWGTAGYEYNQISQTAAVTAEVGGGPGFLYFAWAAVELESGHSPGDTPFFEVKIVKNGTTTIYDVAHFETDGGFWTDTGSYRYSTGNSGSNPGWFVESLDLAALGVVAGDTVTLTALARDCNPSAHPMWVYLDGFGGAPPVSSGVPLPPAALIGVGMLGLLGAARRLRQVIPSRA
jgi:hypothetical protein